MMDLALFLRLKFALMVQTRHVKVVIAVWGTREPGGRRLDGQITVFSVGGCFGEGGGGRGKEEVSVYFL